MKTYTNMVLTEIKMKRDKSSAMLGRFEMSFKQIITVDTQFVTVHAVGKVGRSAKPKNNNGTQQPKKPDDPKPIDADAASYKFFRGLFHALPQGVQKLAKPQTNRLAAPWF